jgi:Ca2+-binding RTX toxin-like protein
VTLDLGVAGIERGSGTPAADTFTTSGTTRIVVYGGAGDDILRGSPAVDVLVGEAGDDQLFGGASDDYLRGDRGDDRLFGEEGDDWLRGGPDGDAFDGGPGRDRVADFSSAEGDTQTGVP